MQPILHNVLVKPYPSNETTDGGLFVPDSCKKPSNRVLLVAVGNGTKKKPMTLKAGQSGFRVKEWGIPVEHDGELHFIMNQSAIIALQ